VLPVWEAYAEVLRAEGYSVATGNLHAEQYGVPQTRKRAILVARLNGEAKLPTPTHSRYYNRTPEKLDDGVLPWVCMADALGWGMTARPSMTVTGGGSATGGAEPFGNGARKSMRREIEAGRWVYVGSKQATATRRNLDHPAPTIDFGHDMAGARWVYGQGRNRGPGAARAPRSLDEPSYTIRANGSGSHPSGTEWVYVNGNQANAARRPADRPAPTVHFGARMNDVRWEPLPRFVQEQQVGRGRLARNGQASRPIRRDDQPSFTITGAGEDRNGKMGGCARLRMIDVSRVAPSCVMAEVASIDLASRPGYSWQGTTGKQYQQVGNAVPSLLARAVLSTVLAAAEYSARRRDEAQPTLFEPEAS